MHSVIYERIQKQKKSFLRLRENEIIVMLALLYNLAREKSTLLLFKEQKKKGLSMSFSDLHVTFHETGSCFSKSNNFHCLPRLVMRYEK